MKNEWLGSTVNTAHGSYKSYDFTMGAIILQNNNNNHNNYIAKKFNALKRNFFNFFISYKKNFYLNMEKY